MTCQGKDRNKEADENVGRAPEQAAGTGNGLGLVTDVEVESSMPVVLTCDPVYWYPRDDTTSHSHHLWEADAVLTCHPMTLTYPAPRHQHDVYLLAFVVGGSGLYEDDSGRLPILAGDVCMVRPAQWHAYPRVQGTLSLVNLAITRSYLVDCAPLLGEIRSLDLLLTDKASSAASAFLPSHFRLSAFELNHFRPLLRALAAEIEDPQASVRPGVRAGLLLQILGMLGGSSNGLHTTQEGNLREDSDLLAAVRYLEERYVGPLTIEELAHQTGYTPTYLTRKFHQRFGMSPSDYLLNLRIQHASALLRGTHLSIASIASSVGFHDSQYFAKRFHQVTGMTPSAYRGQSRSDSDTPQR